MQDYFDEEIEEANEELKRADHLIYITLKYTKTADVIKNIIQRLINAFNFLILDILQEAKVKKLIKEIPTSPKLKFLKVLDVFKDNEEVKDYMEFYELLKKIDTADYTAKEEYRKHLALIAKLEDKNVEVDIETLKQYYEKTKNFKSFVENWKLGEND